MHIVSIRVDADDIAGEVDPAGIGVGGGTSMKAKLLLKTKPVMVALSRYSPTAVPESLIRKESRVKRAPATWVKTPRSDEAVLDHSVCVEPRSRVVDQKQQCHSPREIEARET
jgi:hypothetical protein